MRVVPVEASAQFIQQRAIVVACANLKATLAADAALTQGCKGLFELA